jgi:hypothetical protein
MFGRILTPIGRWVAAWGLITGLLGIQACGAQKDAEAAPEVAAPKTVKLKELIQTIQGVKGKVAVVDFWADY